ncbi:MAG: hypothetical protein IPM64_09795 [Phycisphaerales bacterium]|nr:hypothetical protein [Phycisphaerales bacterium]
MESVRGHARAALDRVRGEVTHVRDVHGGWLSIPGVRIVLWVLIGAVVLFAGRSLIPRWGGGAASGSGDARTPTATIQAACTVKECEAVFAAEVPMDWKPGRLSCVRCGKASAMRATRCDACRKLFANAESEVRCRACQERERAATQPAKKPQGPKGDDADDGW